MPPRDPPIPWASPRAGLLGVLALTAAAYAASLANGFVWDDWTLVVENPVYRDLRLADLLLRSANGIEYLPVKDLSLALDWAIWGARPFGFHLTNVLLYVAGVAAVHAATRRLAAAFSAPDAGAVATWTALVWALHPLHAEAVNFVTARNTLLAGLFAFLALDAALRAIASGRSRPLAAALALFALAALSKAIVVFLPGFVALLALAAPGEASRRRRAAIAALFLAAGAAAAGAHAANAAASGAMSADALRFGTGSAAVAAAKAVQIPFFYLRLLAVPYPLSVEYAPDLLSGAVALRAALAAAGLAGLCALAWRLRRSRPLVALAIAWFLAALLPVANLFPTHPVVADRYAYLPVFGAALAAGALLAAARAGARRAVLAGAGAVAAAWIGLVAARNAAWRTDVSLWESAVAADPSTGREALAEALWQAGRPRDAVAQLRIASGLRPTYRASFYEGRLAAVEGRLDDAAAAMRRALAEGGDGDADVHLALGEVEERRGAHPAALGAYLKAVETADAWTRRSGEAGRAGAERLQARLAPRLDALRARAAAAPRDPAARVELALALHSAGAWEEAEGHYRAALEAGPPSWQLWYNLALTYQKRSRHEDAIAAFERSLQLSGPNVDALVNLGTSQMRLRRYADAERTYLSAIERFPDHLFPLVNLGRTYFVTGDRARSRAVFARARALAAGDPAMQERIDTYLRQLD